MPLQSPIKSCILGGFLLVLMAISLVSCRLNDPLPIEKSDTIVFLGNAFAERMGFYGYFESFLHARFPDHELKIRNLGWSGDEVTLMPRPAGFPSLEDDISALDPDLIFAFFGMNESFRGEEDVEQFEEQLDAFVRTIKSRGKNETPRRVVLVSPIAQEALDYDAETIKERNIALRAYKGAVMKVAGVNRVRFLDLYKPSLELYKKQGPLTINGLHLSAEGDMKIARVMADELGLLPEEVAQRSMGGLSPNDLRRLVYEKNYQFFLKWRGPNAEYIHGERKELPGAHQLPEEMAEIQQLLESYDARIWSEAKPDARSVLQTPPGDMPAWYPTPGKPVGESESLHPETEPYGATPLLSPEESLSKFRLPPGYRVNLFASEANFPIANPMAIQFDDAGRLWVANTPTWPQPLPGRQSEDSIIILEDADGDGSADKHTVFLDRLMMIHGFALDNGGAYISQAPNLIYAGDTNGDLRADSLEVVLQGFGTEDIEHAINNFAWGPDGSLYFMEGIFFHTQVETPRGPVRLNDGGIFRYNPRSRQLSVEASYKFWNPWGQVFDRWGQHIVLDASSADFYPVSVLASNYKYPQDKGRKDGVDPLSFAPRLGSAAGVSYLNSDHFPEEVQGLLMINQFVGFNGIRWFNVEEKGASYDVDMLSPSLLFSADPYFRPVASAIGPDGALYVVDFYSPTFENTAYPKRLASRDHVRGRIWRVVHYASALTEHQEINQLAHNDLLDLLKSEDEQIRYRARRVLQQKQPAEILPDLESWVANLDEGDKHVEAYRLEALWIYEGLNHVADELLREVLVSEDARVRAAATRTLRHWLHDVEDAAGLLEVLVVDPDIRVRLEAVIACGYLGGSNAEALVVEAARQKTDPSMQHAIEETLAYLRAM